MRITLALIALFVFATGGAETVGAQNAAPEPQQETDQVRVLEINNGRVRLDGRVLPQSNIPGGLRLDGIDMTYQFSGPVTPVLEIDGQVYVLDGEHLIRMDEAAPNRANVYFLGQPAMNMPPGPPAPPRGARSADAAESEAAFNFPADDEQLVQAGEEAYLRQLSSRDRSLYDQIQEEQSLELETYRIASAYRSSRDADEREELADELRDKLSESFELKQEIREDEIAQAELQIEELRRLLNERYDRKEQIIERRMRELIGKQGN